MHKGWFDQLSDREVPEQIAFAFLDGDFYSSIIDSLRRGGRLVCVGLPPETDGPMSLPIFPTVLKGISVIGSIVGTRQDLAEVFELHANGRTKVVAEGRKLDQVNESIDEVLSGRTPARLVFEF